MLMPQKFVCESLKFSPLKKFAATYMILTARLQVINLYHLTMLMVK